MIALVAMTLAAMALMRSIDTGLTIAGNLAFKSATTASSDVATEDAAGWLRELGVMDWTALDTDRMGGGYYASWYTGCDMTGNETPADDKDDMQWDPGAGPNAACGAKATAIRVSAGMPSGYSGSYVVTRLCTCEGRPGYNVCSGSTTNVCAGSESSTPDVFSGDVNLRGLSSEEKSRLANESPYYRIVSRVVGPRNTISFVETIVTFSE
jgi:hypothetical protein